ncbi:MAG: hypothetical protein C0608_10240 [Deltaproteobacteria bacterium]|nr:MAG: hypothetical protein C0608_10240 [Deltaproteobacteria bacterium]
MFEILEEVYSTGDIFAIEVAKGVLESHGVFARVKEAGASPYPVSVVTGLADRILMTYPESAKRARELLKLAEEDGVLSGGTILED